MLTPDRDKSSYWSNCPNPLQVRLGRQRADARAAPQVELAAPVRNFQMEQAGPVHGLQVEQAGPVHGLEVKQAGADHGLQAAPDNGLQVEQAAPDHGLKVEQAAPVDDSPLFSNSQVHTLHVEAFELKDEDECCGHDEDLQAALPLRPALAHPLRGPEQAEARIPTVDLTESPLKVNEKPESGEDIVIIESTPVKVLHTHPRGSGITPFSKTRLSFQSPPPTSDVHANRVVQSVPLDALIIEYTAVMKEVLRVLKDLQVKKQGLLYRN
ncbi:hypothetical protein KUF71_007695 [Frankliniella fusca]|uniref:Uncharacterized protein n=1 Tax=Frankliniella fusca TaxID=407009 RepID=A0AAE1HBN2_9NEOP|nr:hypothetical protein KUF71_007695 [Frankliniella fusca]